MDGFGVNQDLGAVLAQMRSHRCLIDIMYFAHFLKGG